MIFILTGTPGSGKTTIAKHLLQRYEYGFHIPLDDLREWVVAGLAQPLPTWTDETTRQFELAFIAAAQLARHYANAGFTVVIDQVIYPHDASNHFSELAIEYQVHKICLQPDIETALARNRSRRSKDFDTALLNEPLKAIHTSLQAAIENAGDWLVIDNSNLDIESTVDQILKHIN